VCALCACCVGAVCALCACCVGAVWVLCACCVRAVWVLQVTSGWEWLGTPDDFKLSTSWQRIEVTHQLAPARVGHRLELGLQLARSAGIILLDDLEVWAPRSADGIPPRIMPPPLPDAQPA
jgi:hypothetical protein